MWCAVVFAVLAVLVGVVRRSWFGRRLTAVRDSEIAAATLGLRGAQHEARDLRLLGFHRRHAPARSTAACPGAVQGSQFEPVQSLVILLFAYVGGITTVGGALIAGALFAFLNYAEATFPSISGVVFIGVAAAAIGLGRQPNGLAGMSVRQPRLAGAAPVCVTPLAQPPRRCRPRGWR